MKYQHNKKSKKSRAKLLLKVFAVVAVVFLLLLGQAVCEVGADDIVSFRKLILG